MDVTKETTAAVIPLSGLFSCYAAVATATADASADAATTTITVCGSSLSCYSVVDGITMIAADAAAAMASLTMETAVAVMP